jgi:hypothetical protein
MHDTIRKNSSPRVYFDEPVELQVKGSDAVIRGRALNLSVGGIYVCSTIALPERCRVELVFALPGGGLIQAEAHVLRVVADEEDEREPAGMALDFCAIEPQAAKLLEHFVASRLQPAQGEPVRLLLGDLSFPIAARTQACFEGFLSVDAELPFLRLNSPVTLARPGSEEHGTGSIRWVSIHVVPETGIPRINIGIELEAQPRPDASAYDEEYDPVCSVEFSEHSHSLDQTVRAQRRQQSAAASS